MSEAEKIRQLTLGIKGGCILFSPLAALAAVLIVIQVIRARSKWSRCLRKYSAQASAELMWSGADPYFQFKVPGRGYVQVKRGRHAPSCPRTCDKSTCLALYDPENPTDACLPCDRPTTGFYIARGLCLFTMLVILAAAWLTPAT